MSAIPAKTGIPDIVDVKISNTVDFHVAYTNYSSVVSGYVNFLALTKYYDSLKYQADPITAEANFWKELANANTDLQAFAKNPKAIKYLKQLEVNLRPGEFLKNTDDGETIIFINTEGNLVAETTDGREIPLTKDTTQLVDKKLQNISSAFDITVADPHGEFIAWWLDKYRKSHFKVKQILQRTINVEDTILQEVSESIGFVFSQYQTPQSRYMHYGDEDSEPTPFPFNSIIDDKLELDTRKNILGLSKRAEALFKRNMQQVITTTDIATKAHRENLVTDHLHYKRLKENQDEINEVIAVVLGGTYKLLSWLTTNKVNNRQKMVPAAFNVVVEKSIQQVDILMNKLERLKRPFNIDILK